MTELSRDDDAALEELFIFFPVMPSYMGRFINVDVVIEQPKFIDYEYADPAWVFSIDGFKEYVEYYDHGA